jgi:ectoine hydroxylase-related dioxygenase (phytanoyl-CoA dioxygenase family)
MATSAARRASDTPSLNRGEAATSTGDLMQQLRTHAVREIHKNDSEDDLHAEEIRNIGYTVVDSGLTKDELEDIRGRIDRVYAKQVEEMGGEANLMRINDANIGRCLLGYDDYFVKLAANERIVSITSRLLGENFILMSQNAIVNQPSDEHYQSTWHRDLNYQHFVSSRPIAISALYSIDEFSIETGGTHMLPASHKSEVFPSTEYVLRHETPMSAPPGSILIFDAMVYHRAGNNQSGRPRRAVNHIFTLPLIKQQINIPAMLNGKFRDDPFLGRLLGYQSEMGESTLTWRQNKLKLATS